jgi:spore coat protein A, manganese oxidase
MSTAELDEFRTQFLARQTNAEGALIHAGSPTPPESWENGFKDTVVAYPGQVTRVRGRFNTPGQFVWHCHIVEHEDNETMRPDRCPAL